MDKPQKKLVGLPYFIFLYLRNEFNFWKVRGIMNTSGLLQTSR